MPLLGFTPNAPTNTPQICTEVSNMIPYEAGMEAAPSLYDIGGDAAAAAILAAFTGRQIAGTRRTFGGTTTKLYEFSTPTWTDVSAGASTYTTGTDWSFTQFGDVTIASNYAATIQQSSSGAFAAIAFDLKARIVEAVATSGGGFVFACNTTTAADGSQTDRWYCSGVNNAVDFVVAAATQCTTGRLIGPGGPITAARRFGADSIVIYKSNALFHGRYVSGDSSVWRFTEVPNVGAAGKKSVANLGFAHFIVAQDGFYIYDGAHPRPVGTKEIKQWFINNVSQINIGLVEVRYDQPRNRVFIFYPSSTAALDKVLVYHLATEQWGKIDLNVQATFEYTPAEVAYSGDTGNYETADNLVFDDLTVVPTVQVAAINTSKKVALLTGAPAASYFQTQDFGEPKQMSRLTEAFLNYDVRPTTATCSAYSSRGLGGVELTGPTELAHDTPLSGTPGRFTLRQHARWHRLQFNFTGLCRVTDGTATIKPAGTR